MATSGKQPWSNLLSTTVSFGSDEETSFCHSGELSSKFSPKSVANNKLQNCSTHRNEEVKLYCRAHETLGCVICMTLSHKLCEIDYIPDVSEEYVKHVEYLNFEANLQYLKERCAFSLNKIEANTVHIEELYSNVVSAVENTRKEIIEELDKFESELREEVKAFRDKHIKTMERLKEACESIEKKRAHTETATKKMIVDKTYNLLFCEVKKTFPQVLEYQSQTYELAKKLCKQECEFQKSNIQKYYLTKRNMFGTIHIKDKELGPCNALEQVSTQPMCYINIKGKDDKKTCYVTGLDFMSSDQLALADRSNKKVKIVDVSYDKIISEIGLSSSPRDITVIPPDRLAVTLRDEGKIQFLSTADGLRNTEQITTNGYCRGIKYDDGKLIVAYDTKIRPKVEILRLNGDVLRTFQFNESGAKLFYEPKCIGLSPDHSHMYVTDLSNMCILRLSRLGEVTAKFGRHKLMGVAVSPGGSVYTCSKSSSIVYQLSDDMSKVETVLTTADGIKEPTALVFSKTRNMLYVSCGNTDANVANKLHVFKTEYENDSVI